MCALHEKHIDWNHITKEKQYKFFKWVAQHRNAWTMNILHTWGFAFPRKISAFSKALQCKDYSMSNLNVLCLLDLSLW